MITENLSTLKINKLTKAQYERELAAGNIDENALYLTPDDGASSGVEISDVEPTAENVQLWINPSNETITSLPEVKDNVVNNDDTWSSAKINSEISALNTNLSEVGKYYSAIPLENVTVESGTSTSVASVTLPKGSYILTGLVRFSANANGYRYANISSTAGATSNQVDSGVPSGTYATQLNLSLCVSIDNEKTLHLNAYQNSGSALTCATGGTFIRAIKIG